MLKLVRKDSQGNARWLVDARMRIGSSKGNDFIIADESVASEHAEIRVQGDEVALVRVCTQGALSVNGRTVKKAVLTKAGDLLCVGTVQLELVDPKEGFVPKTSETVQESAWSIKAMDPSLPEKTFAINKTMVLGRTPECQISISSSHLSRRHAELSIVDGRLSLKDLGSANGTYVNGKKITETFLKRGDLIGFDKLMFTVFGPPDELDKTMVRTNTSGKSVVAPQQVSDMASANDSLVDVNDVVNGDEQEELAEPSPVIKKEMSEQTGSSTAVLLLAGAVVIGAGAALLFLM